MKIKTILCTLFLMAVGTSAFAGWSHGGQIEWESLGNDSFIVTVSVYRDCNGVQVSNSQAWLSSSCGSKNLTLSRVSMADITPVCSNQCSRCSNQSCTFKFGIQKHVFTGLISLADWKKSSCCMVTISWRNCCRTTSLTTGAARNNFYLEAEMNICASSTIMLNYPNDPISIACLGRDFSTTHFQIATNNISDSVVYEIGEPKQSATTRTTWTSPYSYSKPIYFLGFPKTSTVLPRGFHTDASTGELNFRPMKEQSTLLNMKSSVWRNGVYQGSVMREHTFMVVKCPDNNLPLISGANCLNPLTENFNVTACPNDSLNFYICTSDKDKRDTVSLSWEHDIPCLSVSLDNPGDRLQRVVVKWKPSTQMIRNAPYLLRLVARDNACPFNGIIGKTFKIYVRPKTDYNISVSNKKCGTYEFIAKGKDNALFRDATWSFKGAKSFTNTDTVLSDTILETFDTPGFYPYAFTCKHIEHCDFTITDSVFVANDFLQIKMGADSIRACENTLIKLKARAQKAKGNTQFTWTTGDTTVGIKSKITTQFGDQKNWITIAAQDSLCSDTAKLLLIPNLNPDVTFSGSNASCKGDTVLLKPIFSNPETEVASLTSFEWLDSNNTLLSDTGLWYVAVHSGTYQLRLTDTAGCESQSQVLVQHVIPTFNMVPDTSNCINEKIELNVSAKENGRFTWYVGGTNVSNARLVFNNRDKAEFSTVVSEDITVRFEVNRLGVNCSTQKASYLKVNPLPQFRITHPLSICHRDSMQLVSSSFATWKMPHRSLIGDTVWYYAKGTKHDGASFETFLNATDSNGCVNDTQLTMFHLRSPKSGFITPDSVAKNADFVIDNETVSASQNIYSWSIGNPSFLSYTSYQPIMRIDSLGLFEVHLQVVDSVTQCKDASSGLIQVVKNESIGAHFDKHFEVYPNPGLGIFYLNSKLVEDYYYDVYNLSGQVISSGNANQSSIVDLQDHMSGMYIIRVIAPSGTFTTLLEKL